MPKKTRRPAPAAKRPFPGVVLAAMLAGFVALPAPATPALAQAAAQDETARLYALKDEATRLLDLGRAHEAEPVAREALALARKVLGEEHHHTALIAGDLAGVLHQLGRVEESEQLYRHALDIIEKVLPPDHLDHATAINNLAEALRRLSRLDEAEQRHREALAIYERVLPHNDPDIGASLSNLAGVLQETGRFHEAEAMFRRALAIREASLAENHPQIALSLTNLAVVLQHLNALDEAERMHRRALAIYEAVLPDGHPDLAVSLNNLASALAGLGRFEEAERMHRRALAIREQVLPPQHPDIAASLGNLGSTLQNLGRYDEAEALMRRALAIYETALPADHPEIASVLNNLAMALQRLERFEEAAPLHRRALAIREQALPADHPFIALTLSNLASVLQNLDQTEEAERMHRRALAIQQRSLPTAHPEIAQGMENLAIFLGALQGGFEEALSLLDGAAQILTARENRATVAHRGWRERAFFRSAFGEAVWLRDGLDGVDTMRTARRNAFLDLQWERSGGAGGAIAVAMARAQADSDVASLARERDRVVGEIGRLDENFVSVSSDTTLERDVRARQLSSLRAEADALRSRLGEIDAAIADDFPAYAELSEGLPVAADQLMSLLAPDEVLVSITPFQEYGLFYAYGHDGGKFATLPDAMAAAGLAARLRCSAAAALDPACASADSSEQASLGAAEAGDETRGAASLQQRTPAGRAAFDLELASAMYDALFPEEVRDFLDGKKLIIAPAPELMGLPWHLLVTEAPSAGWKAPGRDLAAAYREAAWLFQRHPSITVLPAISSLRALRSVPPERASADLAFLGLGDPVIGRTARERDAAPMACGAAPVLAANAAQPARSVAAVPAALFSGAHDTHGFALADPELVRGQPRLADTRCELEAVAGALGGAGTDLLLGADATETRIRELDEAGALSRYRILHFATHGLLSGELGLGEPGLVLTPPAQASARDDGILTASEIATLTIGADWVVLSACNTAAGSEADAEALSGLARSFFYAGARSLLVSSWPVYSPAAVDVATRTFDAMTRDPSIGRAEALSLAMRAVLANARTEHEAHPSYWAPFFLVGEGNR